ncbi:MAG: tRNA (adenosine(37)-N6)-threonylcarbamoyltransferase complex ATPase subunit type 1 TsaE [Clostridia bacterium]|nr:tRNA (adenosine(37)-N6)-threonylcarbamoyltransferase complex ATPase subunit type 1 TsaE [Clostridia bacterium]
MKYISDSAARTQEIAAEVINGIKPGAVICLDGEMGAGKTVFVQGCMRALGYEGRVTSPTFALCNEYCADGKTVLHYDLCRITDSDDLYSIGFYDSRADLIFVEWAGNECDGAENAVKIKISYGRTENERVIEINE